MSKPRFECDICGADRETVTCNGEGCNAKVCLDCLDRHETECIERCGDRAACDSQANQRQNFRRM